MLGVFYTAAFAIGIVFTDEVRHSREMAEAGAIAIWVVLAATMLGLLCIVVWDCGCQCLARLNSTEPTVHFLGHPTR